jgi:hypothetical protein
MIGIVMIGLVITGYYLHGYCKTDAKFGQERLHFAMPLKIWKFLCMQRVRQAWRSRRAPLLALLDYQHPLLIGCPKINSVCTAHRTRLKITCRFVKEISVYVGANSFALGD